MTVAITINDKAVTAALDALIQAVDDPRPALDEVGQYMLSEIDGLFRAGKSPYGDPWPPSRRAEDEGGTTLVDHGILRGTNTLRVGHRELTIGNPTVYARSHNEGMDEDVMVQAHNRLISQAFGQPLKFPVWQSVSAHTRHMRLPRRQFFPDDVRGLPDDWQAEVLEIFADHIQEAIGG